MPASAIPGVKGVQEGAFEGQAAGGGDELPLEKEPAQVGSSAAVAKNMPVVELAQLDAGTLEGPSPADKMTDAPIGRAASLLELEAEPPSARERVRERMFKDNHPNTLQLVRKGEVNKNIASQAQPRPPVPTAALVGASAPQSSPAALKSNYSEPSDLTKEEEDLVVAGIVKEEEVSVSSKCLSKFCKPQNNLNAGPLQPASPTECFDVCQMRNCERKFKVQGWEAWYSCVQTCVSSCYTIVPAIVKEDPKSKVVSDLQMDN